MKFKQVVETIDIMNQTSGPTISKADAKLVGLDIISQLYKEGFSPKPSKATMQIYTEKYTGKHKDKIIGWQSKNDMSPLFRFIQDHYKKKYNTNVDVTLFPSGKNVNMNIQFTSN